MYAGKATKDERGWSVLRSTASLLLTPASIVVEGISAVSHLIDPEVQKIDYLAVRMWSGGRISGSDKEDIGKGQILCSQGIRAMAQNKLDTAQNLLQKAVDHGNIEAMSYLGHLSLKTKNIEAAKKYFTKAIDAPSQLGIPDAIFRAFACSGLATLSLANNNIAEAKKYCEKGWALSPELVLFKNMREITNKEPSSYNKEVLLERFLTQLWTPYSFYKDDGCPELKEEFSAIIDLLKNADAWAPPEIAAAVKTAFRKEATDRQIVEASHYILGRIYESKTPPDVERAYNCLALFSPGLTVEAALDAAFRAGKLAESMAKSPYSLPSELLTRETKIRSHNMSAMYHYMKAGTGGHKEGTQAFLRLHTELTKMYGPEYYKESFLGFGFLIPEFEALLLSKLNKQAF